MKIAFAFPTNRSQLLKEINKGKSPDNALYGFNHLKGHQVYLCEVSPIQERLLDILFYPLHKLFFKQTDIDFKLGRAILMAKQANQADAIVSNIDGISLALCFLKKLKIIKPPIIYAVGLFYIQGALDETIKSKKNSLFLKLYRWILSGADEILYHAEVERKKLINLNIYDPAFSSFLPMGSDRNFFKSGKKFKRLKNLIVAIGKDRARDYTTLISAAAQLPHLNFQIICRQSNIAGITIPKNVQLQYDLPYSSVRDIYNKASVMVIPIKEMARSSGQMALTDAIQSGIPIIISDVVGIKHYNLQNGVNSLLVPPQDVKELKKAITRLVSEPGLAEKITNGLNKISSLYTTKNYANQLNSVISWVKSDVKLDPITKHDLKFLKDIRNANRNYFLNSNPVSSKDHKNWYRSYLKKHEEGLEYMYLLNKANTQLGTGAIYNINYKTKTAEIGRFIIDNKFRGQKYGQILITKILKIAFNRLNLKKVTLEVLTENLNAIKLYESFDFKKGKSAFLNGKKITVMSLENKSAKT